MYFVLLSRFSHREWRKQISYSHPCLQLPIATVDETVPFRRLRDNAGGHKFFFFCLHSRFLQSNDVVLVTTPTACDCMTAGDPFPWMKILLYVLLYRQILFPYKINQNDKIVKNSIIHHYINNIFLH